LNAKLQLNITPIVSVYTWRLLRAKNVAALTCFSFISVTMFIIWRVGFWQFKVETLGVTYLLFKNVFFFGILPFEGTVIKKSILITS